MILHEDVVQLVIDQVTEVQAEQPELELILEPTGDMSIRGTVRFCIDHESRTYRDAYQIKITIPSDYPDSVPLVKETAGAIAAAFGHFLDTGDLCLAAPVELVRVFSRDRTLHSFIKQLLVPYLFSYTYYREHGQLPHGELSHGLAGLLEYYMEFFNTDPITVMKLLKLLADARVPPLMRCPCNNGRELQDCHGPKLDELSPLFPPSHFEAELRALVATAKARGVYLPERDVLPKRMWQNRQKRRRKTSDHH